MFPQGGAASPGSGATFAPMATVSRSKPPTSSGGRGARIVEIPIVFTERRQGRSKMSGRIVREAIQVVWKLWLQNGMRRRPHSSPGLPCRRSEEETPVHAKTNRGDQPAPHTPWFELGLLFAGSRVLIALIARLGVAIVEPGRFERKTAGLAQLFFHWDSGWFLAIAQDGYHYDPAKGSPIAFFPLYPMLMRALGPLLGGPTVAGFLISNAAFLGRPTEPKATRT